VVCEAAEKLVEVSLAVPGATGPETHVYHNMAVHLYMREEVDEETKRRRDQETE